MTGKTNWNSLIKSLLPEDDLDALIADDSFFEAAPGAGDDITEGTLGPVGAGLGPLTGLAGPAEPEPQRLAVEKLAQDKELSAEEELVIEAIIYPKLRPPIRVNDNAFTTVHPNWLHLNQDGPARRNILAAIPAVGRIDVPTDFLRAYAGTGFVVGANLIMTNRHVAGIFTAGLGRRGLSFTPGAQVHVDFLKEERNDAGLKLDVEEVVLIHPYWDMALLRVAGLPAGVTPLSLSQVPPEDALKAEIATIGYPAFDPRNNQQVQIDTFGGVFNVKRVMPGLATGRHNVTSFGKPVAAAGHDASTLGGASGSAVVETAGGQVVALHFGGRYKEMNYAVPAAELARDPIVVDAGVNFSEPPPAPKVNPWGDFWDQADAAGEAPPPVPAPAPKTGTPQGSVTITVPLQITVSVGTGHALAAQVATGPELTEKMVEPVHDVNYAARPGYDPNFLGIEMPLPQPTNPADISKTADCGMELKYHNFSVFQNKHRRLAQITAANVDARDEMKEPDPDFSYTRRVLNGFTSKNDREKWFTDPRIPASEQLPDRFYNFDRTAFDKGHLVRREAVAWGSSFFEVQMANGDSFHATNCSPQVKGFNRASLGGLWGKLEDDVLDEAENRRLSIFSGPVFADDDPLFDGRDDEGRIQVQIPRRYWKILAYTKDGAVKTFAYVLQQDLTAVDFTEFAAAGEWAPFEKTIPELQALLGNVSFGFG